MRRRVRKQVVSIALFPFLAVLICTMGTLVVLLMLLVQQAKVEAETAIAEQAAAPSPEQREQQLALEDAQWRKEVLEKQRQEKQQELADRRLALSHIEDHIRRLEDSARALVARLKELDEGKSASTLDLAPLQKQLDDLQRELAGKRGELDDKRKQLAAAQHSYTLIPYTGRNGTRRVPLYVECVEEGLIIQPEGTLLTAADLRGPLGPGNPLDAALGAKREYLAKAAGGKGMEPYPLLVVRPSGVIAYHVARVAMKSWDDEFGYELVAEDLNLDFGQRDPQIDQLLQKTVIDARRRQALLVAAMPRQFRREEVLPSFSPEEVLEQEAEKSSAAGRGVGVGRGGIGVGRSEQYADGRAAKTSFPPEAPAGGQPTGAAPTPPAAAATTPPAAAAPHEQHGGSAREAGVAGGVPGAKMGKSLPAGMNNQRRGTNWGLPNARGRTFGVTRPIRVICLRDRLVVLSDRRDAPRPQEFALPGALTAKDVDTFVQAIQKHMEGWGLAAENGYWKPELNVDVAIDAGDRFDELKAALQGSGIEVKRTSP
jgi:hypothetical protein